MDLFGWPEFELRRVIGVVVQSIWPNLLVPSYSSVHLSSQLAVLYSIKGNL